MRHFSRKLHLGMIGLLLVPVMCEARMLQAELNPALTKEIYVSNNRVHAKAAQKDLRNYQGKISKSDVDDLTFILSTMAKSSLAGIATKRSDLKRAGERIEHLHPYRFLEIIFTNEELKAYVAAVRGRAFVWKEFLNGLEGSFEDEWKNKNVTTEQLKDFSNRVGLDHNLLQPYVKDQRWKDLVNKLIDTIPREGNPGRYDM